MGNSWSPLTPPNGRSFIFISESHTVDRCFIIKFAKQHFAARQPHERTQRWDFTVPIYGAVIVLVEQM